MEDTAPRCSEGVEEPFGRLLGLHRNFFYISRFEPAKHHFRVGYRDRSTGEQLSIILSGRKPRDMAKAVPLPGTLLPAEVEEEKQEAFSKFTSTFVEELKQLLPDADPSTVQLEYLGPFSVIDITEFIIRSAGSPAEELKREIQGQLSSQGTSKPSELETLDLELMLSLLDKPAAPSSATPSAVTPAIPFPHPNAGDTTIGSSMKPGTDSPSKSPREPQATGLSHAVVGASIRLCVGKGREILNQGFSDPENVRTFTTTLGELNPVRTDNWLYLPSLASPWPEEPFAPCGTLALPRLNKSQRASLEATVADSVRALARKAYDSPIELLLASQGDPSSPPPYYREFRPVSIQVRQHKGPPPERLKGYTPNPIASWIDQEEELLQPTKAPPAMDTSSSMSMSSLAALPPIASTPPTTTTTKPALQAMFDYILDHSSEEEEEKEEAEKSTTPTTKVTTLQTYLSVHAAFEGSEAATLSCECFQPVEIALTLQLQPAASQALEYVGSFAVKATSGGSSSAAELALSGSYHGYEDPPRHQIRAPGLLPSTMSLSIHDPVTDVHTSITIQNGGIW